MVVMKNLGFTLFLTAVTRTHGFIPLANHGSGMKLFHSTTHCNSILRFSLRDCPASYKCRTLSESGVFESNARGLQRKRAKCSTVLKDSASGDDNAGQHKLHDRSDWHLSRKAFHT